MAKDGLLSEAQRNLLKKAIINIDGDITEEMYMYVRECLLQLQSRGSPDITVYITSKGGTVEAGLGIYDLLRDYAGKKMGKLMLKANSMAAIVLQACDIRKCARHGEMLVHYIGRTGTIGLDEYRDKEKLDKVIADLEKSQERINEIYRTRTNKPQEELNELFKEEKRMSSEEALALGFIDEIM